MKTSLACLALAGSAAAFAPAQQASFSTKLNSAVPEGYDDLIGEFLLLCCGFRRGYVWGICLAGKHEGTTTYHVLTSF